VAIVIGAMLAGAGVCFVVGFAAGAWWAALVLTPPKLRGYRGRDQ